MIAQWITGACTLIGKYSKLIGAPPPVRVGSAGLYAAKAVLSSFPQLSGSPILIQRP